MSGSHNFRFTLICLAMFLAGGLLRWQAGWLVMPWPGGAGALAGGADLDAETLAAMQGTVIDFYTRVDKGDYQAAYGLSFENKWHKLESGQYTPVGLVSVEEFGERLSDEIGGNGMGLNIVSIGVLSQTVLLPEAWQSADRPELQALYFLPEEVQPQSIYQVQVGGVLLGRCSRWDWQDTVLVLYLRDGRWRLLLPGSLNSYSPHHEEWFLDRNPFKGKEILPAGQGI